MIKKSDLKFEKSSILTKVMLDELYEFPKDIINIYYDKNLDGILYGTNLIETDNSWYISKGLIKFDGDLYRMNEDFPLTEYINDLVAKGEINNQNQYKLLIIKEKSTPTPIENRTTQMETTLSFKVVEKDEKIDEKFIFFTSFKLMMGNQISPSLNFNTLINSEIFKMIDCPFSYKGYITYHPYIFDCINKYLVEKPNKTGIEYVMINEILTNNVLDINFMKTLINDKNDKLEKKYTLFTPDTLVEKKSILSDFYNVIQKSFNTVITVENIAQPSVKPTKSKSDGLMW